METTLDEFYEIRNTVSYYTAKTLSLFAFENSDTNSQLVNKKEKSDGEDIFFADDSIPDQTTFINIFQLIVEASDCEIATVIYSMLLIDKFLLASGIKLDTKNIVLISITAFSISLKYNEDMIISGNDFALKILHLNKTLLAELELSFLKILDYKIHYSKECLAEYADNIFF